jgi:hypothetical protein
MPATAYRQTPAGLKISTYRDRERSRRTAGVQLAMSGVRWSKKSGRVIRALGALAYTSDLA